jgi:hypothetical protein
VNCKVVVVGVLICMARAAGASFAQESDNEPIPTEPPTLMSKPSDLKTALDECKSHPSVVHGGTPFEVCMDAYGFVKDGEHWVHKPETR